MGDVIASVVTNVGGLATLVVAILYIAYAIRNDSAKTLGARVLKLEYQLAAEARRRFQLESILRTNGIEVPTWDNYPDYPPDPSLTTTRSPS